VLVIFTGHVNVVSPLFEVQLEVFKDLIVVAVPDLALDRDVDGPGRGAPDLDRADVRVEDEFPAGFDFEGFCDRVVLAGIRQARGDEGQCGQENDRITGCLG